jgi:hypothetical protein
MKVINEALLMDYIIHTNSTCKPVLGHRRIASLSKSGALLYPIMLFVNDKPLGRVKNAVEAKQLLMCVLV